MSGTTIKLLFLASFILLVGLGGAALLIDSANRARRRLAVRLDGIRSDTGPTVNTPSVRLAVKQHGPLEQFAGLVSCDLAHKESYPMPWWVVLVLGVIAGRVVASLTTSLFGSASLAAWPVVAFLVCRGLFRNWNAKRYDKMLAQFPDALGMVIRTVRIGLPILEGIRLAGRESPEPTGAEFRQLLEEIAIGVPVEVALRMMAQRTSMAEYRFFATAVALQVQTGGGLSEALDTLSDVVRKRLALRSRGFALTSEARTSALVLAVLPFFIGGTLALLSPGYLDVLFETDTGNEMLAVGAISLVIGIATMRTMIRRTLS